MATRSQKISNYTCVTDVGNARELNEDSLFCSDNLWLVAGCWLLVADGGHACGEVASRLAAKIIAEEYQRTANLVKAIEAAHHQIVEAGNKGQGQLGMGTTVVAAASRASAYEVAWVGDSRAYLWEQNNRPLRQVSEDHSLVTPLVKLGLVF